MPDHELSERLPAMLKEAVASAIRETLADQELTRRFWAEGYNQLQAHAVNNGSQWVGKRLLTAVVTAIVTAGVIWLVKSGAIK